MSPDNSLDFAATRVQHTPMRLLIIEDDRDAADYLVKAFREVGHVADWSADGEDGLALALDGAYDVLIVDRMLPKRDGLSVISALRAQGRRDAGADPLGARPGRRPRQGPARRRRRLSAQALFVRRTAGARRGAGAPARRARARRPSTASAISSSTGSRTASSAASDEIDLQPREFRLLEYLMKHAGQVVTRTMLLENVWDYHFDPQTNVIDVHISRLRSKIDKGFAQPLLHTVRGAGYMIRDGAR